jgi:hypothetical protein
MKKCPFILFRYTNIEDLFDDCDMEEFFTLLHQKIIVISGSRLEPVSTGSVDTDPGKQK